MKIDPLFLLHRINSKFPYHLSYFNHSKRLLNPHFYIFNNRAHKLVHLCTILQIYLHSSIHKHPIHASYHFWTIPCRILHYGQYRVPFLRIFLLDWFDQGRICRFFRKSSILLNITSSFFIVCYEDLKFPIQIFSIIIFIRILRWLLGSLYQSLFFMIWHFFR